MLRGLRLATIAAMVIAALATPAADAAPELVRIADPTARLFVTASTTDTLVRMQPRQVDLQTWALDRISPTPSTTVVNSTTRGCLTVALTVPIVDGVPVVQRPCQGQPIEQWRVVPDNATRTVRFGHVVTGMCMTVDPASTVRFPLLRLFRCTDSPAQRFTLLNG